MDASTRPESWTVGEFVRLHDLVREDRDLPLAADARLTVIRDGEAQDVEPTNVVLRALFVFCREYPRDVALERWRRYLIVHEFLDEHDAALRDHELVRAEGEIDARLLTVLVTDECTGSRFDVKLDRMTPAFVLDDVLQHVRELTPPGDQG